MTCLKSTPPASATVPVLLTLRHPQSAPPSAPAWLDAEHAFTATLGQLGCALFGVGVGANFDQTLSRAEAGEIEYASWLPDAGAIEVASWATHLRASVR